MNCPKVVDQRLPAALIVGDPTVRGIMLPRFNRQLSLTNWTTWDKVPAGLSSVFVFHRERRSPPQNELTPPPAIRWLAPFKHNLAI